MTNKKTEQTTRKFIVTGGPGCGKTTVLKLIAKLGYEIVPESARQVLQANNGLVGMALQEAIMQRQTELEGRVTSRVAFLDRGLPDCEAYAKYFGDSLEGTSYDSKLSNANYQNKVFILEPLPRELYKNDAERNETYEEAVKISEQLDRTYGGRGFSVERVAFSNPEQRANEICASVNVGGKK